MDINAVTETLVHPTVCLVYLLASSSFLDSFTLSRDHFTFFFISFCFILLTEISFIAVVGIHRELRLESSSIHDQRYS